MYAYLGVTGEGGGGFPRPKVGMPTTGKEKIAKPNKSKQTEKKSASLKNPHQTSATYSGGENMEGAQHLYILKESAPFFPRRFHFFTQNNIFAI